MLLLGALGSGMALGTFRERAAATKAEPEVVTTTRSSESVVRAVRDLARLQTTTFHVERVIDMREGQATLFGLVRATDQVLLVASGEVTAGVDLTRMGDTDVLLDAEGRKVTLRLPAPEIFSARLDNDRTYVHTRKTDLLARRSAKLETDARREAESFISEAAVEAGVLDRARKNAGETMRSLLRGLDFDEVEILWLDQVDSPELRAAPPKTKK